ncbi:MAG: hypothetical protein GVY26_20945 [Bacteroidetes bacterium]|jgi:hypothetical protein|nr:hypothetical protein [Bacteroidota bacterium]
MAEQNRHTLEKALQQLPLYDPPAALWPQIERVLEADWSAKELYDALEQLPAYQPPPQVWQAVEQALQEAQDGEAALSARLSALPAYDPPAAVWKHIDQLLQASAQEAPLREQLQQLPDYDPPAEVWENIEQGLPDGQSGQTVPLRTWLARAAAVIALVIGTWYFWPSDYNTALQATYGHSTETAGLAWNTAAEDWADEEAAIAYAVKQFQDDPLARSSDHYHDLMVEWKELNEAKDEITEIMELYGKDAQLIRQMSEIEQERSSLLRRMVREI